MSSKKPSRRFRWPNKPASVPIPQTLDLKAALGDAPRQLQQGGFDQAVTYLTHLAKRKGAAAIPLAVRLTLLGQRVHAQDPQTALALAEKALEHSADCLEAWVLAGSMQDRLGQRDRSAASMLQVIRSERATPAQVLRAANLLVRFGQQDMALAAAKTAYDQLGRPLRQASVLLYIAQRAADWPLVDALTAQLRDAYAQGLWDEVRETPRTHVLWCDDEAINIQVVQHWSVRNVALPAQVNRPHPQPLAGRRLRVGYLSSDFREHPTSRLINGLLRHHDRNQIELFMYCSGWDDGSPLRKEVERHFEHVHAIAALSDADAAHLIRTHSIDVLVELNGPTRANRLGILAHRPAPVQIDYLGWPGSVGGRVVDYIIGDEYTVSPGQEQLYPEKVIRLQRTYQINDYAAQNLPPAPSRADVGLPEGDIRVLGVFNAINKVRGEVWAVWMRILRAVPTAVLWILDPGPVARKHIAEFTKAHGVNPQRILAAPLLKQDAHLARLQCCDLMLDPWPYGGHTSTADALFVGTPVLALEGKNFAGRVNGGLLRAAGLEVLVQKDIEAYCETAVRLLRRPNELARIKAWIRERVPRSDIFNAQSRTRQLEAAYRVAYDQALRGEEPRHLTLKKDERDPARRAPPVSPKPPVAAPLANAPAAVVDRQRIRLALVCGPWSSGTSAVAGMLAKVGLQAPGPYVQVNDPRTAETFEMKALQGVLRTLASEQTLKRLTDDANALQAIQTFRDQVLLPSIEIQAEPRLVLLKHPLTALFLPQLCAAFEVRIVCVVRPLSAIEATRQRRQWQPSFGKAGAAIIYQHLFNHLINTNTPFHTLRYPELLTKPEAELDRLLAFCGVQPSIEQRQAALAFVSRPGSEAMSNAQR